MRCLLSIISIFLAFSFAPAIGDEKDGWELMRKRDYAAALKRFEQEANQYREWAELHDAMGWCHYFLEEYEEAKECFLKALVYKPEYKWSQEGLEAIEAVRRAPLETADALLAAGRYTEARAAYQRIHEGETAAEQGAKIPALAGEGWSLYYLGRYREATKCFRNAHKKDRKNADTLRGLAYCDYAQGEYRRALTSLRLALELEPAHTIARLTAGWAHYFSEDWDKALAEFEIAEDSAPRAWDAWSGIGWCRVRMGEQDAALEAFRRGIEISPHVKTADLVALIEADPEWRILHNVAGWSALRASLSSWALTEFQTSEALGCGVGEAQSGQAFALFRVERYAEAAKKAHAAIDAGEGDTRRDFPVTLADGSSARVAMNLESLLAWIAHRQGRYDEALAGFRAVREKHHDWVDPVCGEGWVLNVQGNYPAAEKAFDTALELLPGYSDAVSGAEAIHSWRYADYDRGWAALLAGDVDGARGHFERIVEDSRNPYPLTRMDRIEASLGWVAFRAGDERSAVQHFEQALAMTPELGLAEMGWGYLDFAAERWLTASHHLTAAVADPELADDAELRATLGRCLLEQGKMSEAEAVFTEAVALSPSYAAAHAGQAIFYLRNSEPVAARIALERAFALDPTISLDPTIAEELGRVKEFVRLHSPLGWAWFYREEYERAEASFRLAIVEDPLETTAPAGLGWSLLRQGELKEGRAVLEAYLRKAPKRENPWGLWSSSLSELSWALFHAGNHRDALAGFRRLEMLHKGEKERYADPLDGQGWCLLRTGSKLAARKKFEEALAITPGHSNSLAGLVELDGGANAGAKEEGD